LNKIKQKSNDQVKHYKDFYFNQLLLKIPIQFSTVAGLLLLLLLRRNERRELTILVRDLGNIIGRNIKSDVWRLIGRQLLDLLIGLLLILQLLLLALLLLALLLLALTAAC
jgi:hypothetical protein